MKIFYPWETTSRLLFCRVASGSQNDNSDVDLLVEFKTPNVSLFTLSALKIRIEELLGTPVDLIHAPIPKDSLITIGRTISLYEYHHKEDY